MAKLKDIKPSDILYYTDDITGNIIEFYVIRIGDFYGLGCVVFTLHGPEQKETCFSASYRDLEQETLGVWSTSIEAAKENKAHICYARNKILKGVRKG